MIIDKSHEQYSEMRLYYDVMEIGLGVMGSVGETEFFQFIDNALDTFNEAEMRAIKRAFEMLSVAQQDALVGTGEDKNLPKLAATSLENICGRLCKALKIHSEIA